MALSMGRWPNMRTTRKEVEGVFKLWVAAVGGHVASSYSDVNGYRLDHNSVYGGYCIERICNESGGVSVVLDHRQSAYAFVTSLRMAMRSLEEARANSLAEVR